MGLAFWKEKAVLYYRKNGFWQSVKQLGKKVKESVFAEPDVIYFADLVHLKQAVPPGQDGIRVVERRTANEITAEEREALYAQIGRKLIEPQMKERFDKGVSAWFVYRENQFAGMVWTLVGDTMEPFYYFIAPEDVHVFNNVIFPEYRGKGINPVLIETVLQALGQRGFVRAYIETSVRNLAEQRSLSRTSFRPMGIADKKKKRGRQVTRWSTEYDAGHHGR